MNLAVDRSVTERMTGMEISDVNLVLTRQTAAEDVVSELEKMAEVRKTSMTDIVFIKIAGYDTMVFISDDFSRLETTAPYEGSFPQWDNEIVIAGVQAKELQKEVGDMVQVRAAGVTREYVISGLISTTNGAGLMSALSLEGYRRMVPSYRRQTINVYLREGVVIADFIQALMQRFGVVQALRDEDGRGHLSPEQVPFASAKARAEELISNYLYMYGQNSVEYAVMYNGEVILSGSSSAYQIEKIVNYRQQINTQIDVLTAGFQMLMQVSVCIAAAVIALVLSMTVRTILIKRRVELGILKAAGYRTGELSIQMGISFLPAAVIGIAVGCAVGSVSVTPLFLILLRSAGVSNVRFVIHYGILALLCVGLILLVVFAAMVSALRIKDISVYELLAE
jgi:putative ABC transport system permease protein